MHRKARIEDEVTVVIRFAMTWDDKPKTVEYCYAILTATADGWRVDLYEKPIA